jgi:hypothetical protein
MEKVTLLFAVVALGLGCQAVDRGGQLDDNKALVLRAHGRDICCGVRRALDGTA